MKNIKFWRIFIYVVDKEIFLDVMIKMQIIYYIYRGKRVIKIYYQQGREKVILIFKIGKLLYKRINFEYRKFKILKSLNN